MRIFISAGEPSGDLHGANLIRELQARWPNAEIEGFGGDKMADAGCNIHFPLCHNAVMGFARVFAKLPVFLDLISRTDRYFRHHKPDAVVLVDFPGFNFWVAKRAHFHGIPVFYFVPPQLWAWLGHRVKKMQRWVTHVLCNLPFEKRWYEDRNVKAHYVGHPYFDELAQQKLDANFLSEQRRPDGDIIGLLPGSRHQEVERNFPTLYRAANLVHKDRPDTRFLVACYSQVHKQKIDDYLRTRPPLPLQTCVGRTPEIIELAKACVAVSGSVSLELLYRATPSIIVYRLGRILYEVAKRLVTVRYMTLVNLLADKELYREFPTYKCEAEGVAAQLLEWLNDADRYNALRAELEALRHEVVIPGACGRAADFIVEKLSGQKPLETQRRAAA